MIVLHDMRRRGATAVARMLATAVLGACGGGHRKSDQQAIVTQAPHSYLRAQAAGDGQAACGRLTAAGQRQLIALVVKAAKGLMTTQPSCEEAVGLVRALAGAKLLSALESARIESVRVSGARPTAEIVDGAQFQPGQVTLAKHNLEDR